MNGRVLVLNASFEPINVCTERRAVVMIFKGVARMEEHNGHMLHSAKLSIHAPSVIRLTEYIHIPFERRSLSRKNILLRDHSTCQYCGKQYRARGTDARSRSSALARRRFDVGQSGGVLQTLQSSQRQPDAGRGRNASACAARAGFRCTSIARSCAILDAQTRRGASIFSMNRTPESSVSITLFSRLGLRVSDVGRRGFSL